MQGDGPDPAARARAHYEAFDLLRVVGALLVLGSHSFALTGRREMVVLHLGALGLTWGGIAVASFFTISGYLVSGSWMADPAPARFALKRVARLWPAFSVVVIVVAVAGALVTTMSIDAYFAHPWTWRYVLQNLLMSPIRVVLPGVFSDLPHPRVVNGSIWTLPYEVVAYCGILVLGSARLLGRWWVLIAVLALALAGLELSVASTDRWIWPVWNGLVPRYLFGWGAFFLAGALLRRLQPMLSARHRGDMVGVVAVVALLVGAVLRQTSMIVVSLAVVLVWTGTRSAPPAVWLRRLGDPSYGIYLWSYPAQQLIVWLGWHGDEPWRLTALATALTVPVAYASWHLIEQPSIRWARARALDDARR